MKRAKAHLYFRDDSPYWHGVFIVAGNRVRKQLDVKVDGARPPSAKCRGDDPFERSKTKAAAAYFELKNQIEQLTKDRKLAEKVLDGDHRYERIPLTSMYQRWAEWPRKKNLSAGVLRNGDSMISAFVDFMQLKFPQVVNVNGVAERMASAYMTARKADGISEKTYKNITGFLSTVFRLLKTATGMELDPFSHLKVGKVSMAHRVPYSVDDLRQIFERLKDEEFLRPIIVTATCTALRRGDLCLIKWSSINWELQQVKVRTSKTNGYVWIPIFPALRRELELARKVWDGKADSYVFPEQAKRFGVFPEYFTDRLKGILADLGIEKVDDETLRPTGNRMRVASQRDLHALRVTWATLAILSGVPESIVVMVTGHASLAVLRKHYFQPKIEDTRRVLQSKLPAILLDWQVEPQVKNISPATVGVVAELERMTDVNWKQIRDQLLVSLSTNLPLEGRNEIGRTEVAEQKVSPSPA